MFQALRFLRGVKNVMRYSYFATDMPVLFPWRSLDRHGDFAAVGSGLKDGDRVIVSGTRRLMDGDPVEGDGGQACPGGDAEQMNLGSFSVRNHVLVNILMFALLVLGLLSLQRMPREQFSEVPFFWVTISVPYPGASPEDIERSVTIKIENVMQGLKSLKSVSSVSSEGLSRVRVEFEDGIDA